MQKIVFSLVSQHRLQEEQKQRTPQEEKELQEEKEQQDQQEDLEQLTQTICQPADTTINTTLIHTKVIYSTSLLVFNFLTSQFQNVSSSPVSNGVTPHVHEQPPDKPEPKNQGARLSQPAYKELQGV